MPRGEGGINPSDPSSKFYDPPTTTTTKFTGSPRPNRLTGNPARVDPLTGKRYSGRAGFGPINPAFLKARKIVYTSLISKGIDPAMASIVTAFDPLKINQKK